MNPLLWFHDHGVSIFPIVVGTKEPAVAKGTSWKGYLSTRAEAGQWRAYGVELGLVAVADSDTPTAEAWIAAHLLDTPFKVTTGPYHDGSPGRGRQRIYRIVRDAPHFFYRDNLTIEFRHRGQYVLGAGSIHPSGLIYTADDWSWNINDVPFFPVADFHWDDRPVETRGSLAGEPFEFPEKVCAGERHYQLFKLLRSCKAKEWDRDTTREVVTLANRGRCVPPLAEDNGFEQWFDRAWNQRDRLFDGVPSLSTLQRAWLDGR